MLSNASKPKYYLGEKALHYLATWAGMAPEDYWQLSFVIVRRKEGEMECVALKPEDALGFQRLRAEIEKEEEKQRKNETPDYERLLNLLEEEAELQTKGYPVRFLYQPLPGHEEEFEKFMSGRRWFYLWDFLVALGYDPGEWKWLEDLIVEVEVREE